jgi:hypothetical protein
MSRFIQFQVDDPGSFNPATNYAEFSLPDVPVNQHIFTKIEIIVSWSSPTTTNLNVQLKSSGTTIWSNSFAGSGGPSDNIIFTSYSQADLADLSVRFSINTPGSKIFAVNVRTTGLFGVSSTKSIMSSRGGGASLSGCSLVSGGTPLKIGGALVAGSGIVSVVRTAHISNLTMSGGINLSGFANVSPLIGGGGVDAAGVSRIEGGNGLIFQGNMVTQYLKPKSLVQMGSWSGDWTHLKGDVDSNRFDNDPVISTGTSSPLIITMNSTVFQAALYSKVVVRIRMRQSLQTGSNFLRIQLGLASRSFILSPITAPSDYAIAFSQEITTNSSGGITISQSDVDFITIQLTGDFSLAISGIDVAVVSSF